VLCRGKERAELVGRLPKGTVLATDYYELKIVGIKRAEEVGKNRSRNSKKSASCVCILAPTEVRE